MRLVLVLFRAVYCSRCTVADVSQEAADHHTRFCLWQWHRTPTTQETDGFQVKRPGDVSVRCTLLLMLDYQVSALRLAWETQLLGHEFILSHTSETNVLGLGMSLHPLRSE